MCKNHHHHHHPHHPHPHPHPHHPHHPLNPHHPRHIHKFAGFLVVGTSCKGHSHVPNCGEYDSPADLVDFALNIEPPRAKILDWPVGSLIRFSCSFPFSPGLWFGIFCAVFYILMFWILTPND